MTRRIRQWDFAVVTLAHWLNKWRIWVIILTFLAICVGIYAVASGFKR